MSKPTRHPHKWIINNLDKAEVIESDFRNLEAYIEDKEIQVGILVNKIEEANEILDEVSGEDADLLDWEKFQIDDFLKRLKTALLIPRKDEEAQTQ